MVLPMMAAAPHLPPVPPPDPTAPGPFAFADPDSVPGNHAEAGFDDIQITPHNEKVGGGDLDTAVDLALRVGPLGRMMRENPGAQDAVVDAVRKALAAHDGPDGVKLDSATWIVTARTPG